MTDYSDWVLKDEDEELLFGPVQDEGGWWAYVYKKNGQIIAVSGMSDGSVELNFKPPVVWTYYYEDKNGTLITWGESHLATHRSCDGGDTIERIEK